MAAKTPAAHASAAAESVRSLNHATLSLGRSGWRFPGDAYDVIGGLDHAASMLPQALDQVWSLLSRLAADGHMLSDRGTLTQDMTEARYALNDARAAAQRLNAALTRAHSATSHLAWQE